MHIGNKWEIVNSFERSGKLREYSIYIESLIGKTGRVNFTKGVGSVIGLKENIEGEVTIFYCEIVKRERINKRTVITLKNIEDGVEFKPVGASEIMQGKISEFFNLIRYRTPHIIKYLKDKTIADTLTSSSPKKVECICPICGHEKEVIVSNLVKQGMGCICTKTIPYTERLMASVLDFVQIEYQTQIRLGDSKFRYDFYLPSYGVIIETHGMQHYDYGFEVYGGKTLQEEQENDRAKREFALLNGIKEENYHEVDCRHSTLKWCKPNIEEVLSLYLTQGQMDNIDWIEVETKAQKNQKLEVVKYWQENKTLNPDLTTTMVSEKLGIPIYSVNEYLQWGNELGLCHYDGAMERKAYITRVSNPICVVNEQNEIIESYPSIREMSRSTNIGRTTIREHLMKGTPFIGSGKSGGFNKKYIGKRVVSCLEDE